MKFDDSRPTSAVIGAWRVAIESEFGRGRGGETDDRVADIAARLIDEPQRTSSLVIEFGLHYGAAGQPFDVVVRSFELLVDAGGEALADRLSSREVAVLLAEGWSSASMASPRATDAHLTPLPSFLQLLGQRYVSADVTADRLSKRVVLVVVDLRETRMSQIEFERLRTSTIDVIRGVWPAAQPISEGARGSFVVMVERDESLHAAVGNLRRMVLAQAGLHANRVHVWIEPLSDAGLHLAPHVASLIGPVELNAT